MSCPNSLCFTRVKGDFESCVVEVWDLGDLCMWCPLQYNRLVGTNHVSQRFQVLVSVARAWQHVLLTPVANTKVTTTGIAVPQYQALRPKGVVRPLSLSLPPKPTENVGDASLSLKQSQCRRQFHVSCCEMYEVSSALQNIKSVSLAMPHGPVV